MCAVVFSYVRGGVDMCAVVFSYVRGGVDMCAVVFSYVRGGVDMYAVVFSYVRGGVDMCAVVFSYVRGGVDMYAVVFSYVRGGVDMCAVVFSYVRGGVAMCAVVFSYVRGGVASDPARASLGAEDAPGGRLLHLRPVHRGRVLGRDAPAAGRLAPQGALHRHAVHVAHPHLQQGGQHRRDVRVSRLQDHHPRRYDPAATPR